MSGYVIVQRNQAGEVTNVFHPDDGLYTKDQARYWADEDNAADDDGHTNTVARVVFD